MSKLGEYLAELDERQTQFHLLEAADRKNIDRYPVLKELLRQNFEGSITADGAKHLRRLQYAAKQAVGS